MAQAVPYWRLSAFYFFYFALLGTWLPYWSLYLKSLGYSSGEIGILSALVMVTKVLAPNLWGYLADRYDCRTRIIRLGALLAVIAFGGVYFRQDFYWLAAVVVGYSFFWNAVLSQFDVLTLSHLSGQHGRYSLIRLWGSIGFIAAVLAVGAWLDHHPIVHLLYIITALLSAIWLGSLLVAENPEGLTRGDRSPGSLMRILKQPAVIAFFATSFLLQFSHGPYYTFFSIHLEAQGYSKSATGMLWSLGVFAEVLLFMGMHRLLERFSLRQILIASLALTALRWWLIAEFVESVVILVFAQCLHAASFGSAHAAAVETIRRFFTAHHGQGMALYSGLSFGAGGALGAVLSGYAWDISPAQCFWVASGAAALAAIIAWRYFETPDTPR
ncbi:MULTISPECIES: MFS transporter [unclassified Spongiibacter]|jgi:PPP family 3-phenylpropionic acid transporter|uniref:MFS transporter n=1 Tax=Spongiibacter TaxID=630749 RepID=UPI00257B18E5|nr:MULTISPECIES: MFS transporter [unclassified Spongiibacter]|tara:strand:- start:2199 stop:3353 length:1155 start_codon:yes stop_codon:yes gene_type:complete